VKLKNKKRMIKIKKKHKKINGIKAICQKYSALGPIPNMPWQIVPFIFPMFILVQALKEHGWISKIAFLFANMSDNYNFIITLIVFLGFSLLFCNIINNLPMAILFSRIMLDKNLNFSIIKAKHSAIFGTILGSNYGADLTIIGALAGIMWTNILKRKQIRITYLEFLKTGVCVLIPSVICSGFILGVEISRY